MGVAIGVNRVNLEGRERERERGEEGRRRGTIEHKGRTNSSGPIAPYEEREGKGGRGDREEGGWRERERMEGMEG